MLQKVTAKLVRGPKELMNAATSKLIAWKLDDLRNHSTAVILQGNNQCVSRIPSKSHSKKDLNKKSEKAATIILIVKVKYVILRITNV